MKKSSTLKQLDWDISTITPGDYTLQLEITTAMWNHFLQEIYNRNDMEAQGVSRGFALKTHVKTELERILTETLNKVKAERPDEAKNINITQVKIADIVFAFNNAELIHLLRERGGYIARNQYGKMREVEEKISQLKDEKFDSLTKPVDAFITFEAEDGSIIGQYFEDKKDKETADFLGTDLVLKESTEPTNIIWENRHWTDADYRKRTAIVYTIIFLLILISFGMIFACKQTSIKISSTYPIVDCTNIRQTYNSTGKYYDYVNREYQNYYKFTGAEKTPLNGPLQCFCADQKTAGADLNTVTTPGGSVPVCKEYKSDFDI